MKPIRRWLSAVLVLCALALPGVVRADSINFAIGIINPSPVGLPVSVTFNLPSSLTGLVAFNATLGVMLIDGNGNGASVAPIGGFIVQGLIDGTIVGQDSLGTLTTSFAPVPVFSGLFNCSGSCSPLTLILNFTLSAFDAALLVGSFTVVPMARVVAEPQMLVLLLLAFGALAFFTRGRRGRALRT